MYVLYNEFFVRLRRDCGWDKGYILKKMIGRKGVVELLIDYNGLIVFVW